MNFLLRVRGASQIVQVCKNGEKVLLGAAMKQIAILNEEIVGDRRRRLGVIVNNDGKIESIGLASL